MAKPVDFPQSNLTLVGSPEDKAAGIVVDLPVHRYQDLDGNWHVISKWKLTPDEEAEVMLTGCVWLHSWGHTHPPIAVDGTDPWKEK
jgi:hypothetical protein